MNLVVVESPTKARKLSSYLGKDFQVEASVGHIRDLPKSGLNIDVDKDFEPTYAVSPDKKKVIAQLVSAAKKADKIYLATDPDREGEAIAWHVQAVLEAAKTVKGKEFLRATFNEITKPAVLKAIENPAKLNMNLIDAQQARRVVDRLVGYQVSPVLWKKIRRGLSAGRVQSVALRLIVEREREIEAFKPEEFWEVDVAVDVNEAKKLEIFKEGKPIEDVPETILIGRVTELDGKNYEPKKEDDVKSLREVLPGADYKIKEVERKERRRKSMPPFTTSTMQQRAATRLGMSGKQSMSLAQNLYEEGLITYHRTDSVNLSQSSIEMARQYISDEFGAKYLPKTAQNYAATSKNAQEAHEAIRVTDAGLDPESIISKSAKFTKRHVQLYDLIRRRFIASQMTPAVYDQTSIITEITPKQATAFKKGMMKTNGSILTFDGWMKLFPGGDDSLLPDVEVGQTVHYTDGNYAQKFTQPPARYNDASLIKTLEKMGIGRPSTYASIISVIEDRGYVEKQQKRFFASTIGMTVTDFLLEHFDTFMDYEFTAEMEEDLDRIARGEKQWRKVVGTFYKPFHERVEKVTDNAERKQIPVEKTGEICPDCGEEHKGEIVIRTGRFGKFKSCNRFPDCKYTENIVQTVEDVVCPLCGKGGVVMKNTRWGKPFFGCSLYPKCDWASWKQPEKGETISKADWAIYQEKRAERKKKWQDRKDGKKASPAKKPAAKKKAAAKK